MRVIVRRIYRGFRARFDIDERWSEWGRTKAEAVGNLIMSAPQRVGIQGVFWDRQDEWTRRYLEGKSNRQKPPAPAVDFDALPQTSSTKKAMELRVSDLPLNTRFRNLLMLAGYELGYSSNLRGDVSLGQLCNHTVSEIQDTSSKFLRIGTKTIGQLHGLLAHYGLSLRGE